MSFADKKKVLVVDPDMETLRPMVEHLRGLGYEVELAFDVPHASLIAARLKPDLVVLEQSASSLLKDLSKRGIPVVGLTSSRGPCVQEMIEGGALWADDKFYVIRHALGSKEPEDKTLLDEFDRQVALGLNQQRGIA